jgi:hypothetical protein
MHSESSEILAVSKYTVKLLPTVNVTVYAIQSTVLYSLEIFCNFKVLLGILWVIYIYTVLLPCPTPCLLRPTECNYSKLPNIQHVPGMGCASCMRRTLIETQQKTKTCFHFSSCMGVLGNIKDWWVTHFEYTLTQPQIQLASTVKVPVWGRMMGSSGSGG